MAVIIFDLVLILGLAFDVPYRVGFWIGTKFYREGTRS